MARTMRGGTRRPVKRKYRKSRRQKGGATLTLPGGWGSFAAKGGRQMGGAETLTLPKFVNPFQGGRQMGGATLTLPMFVNPFSPNVGRQTGGAETLTLPTFVNPFSDRGRQTGGATVSLSGGTSVVRKGGRRQMGGLNVSELEARVALAQYRINNFQALIAAGNNTPEINSELLRAQNELKAATSQLEELRQLQQTTTGSAGLTGPAGPTTTMPSINTCPPFISKGDVSNFSSLSTFRPTNGRAEYFKLNRLVGPYNLFAVCEGGPENSWTIYITKLPSLESMCNDLYDWDIYVRKVQADAVAQGRPLFAPSPINISSISELPANKDPATRIEDFGFYKIPRVAATPPGVSEYTFSNFGKYWVRNSDNVSHMALAEIDALVGGGSPGPTMPPLNFKGDVSSFSSIGNSYSSTTFDIFRLNRLVGPYNVFAMWMGQGVNKWCIIITKLTSLEKYLTESNEYFALLNKSIDDMTRSGNRPPEPVPVSINNISNLPSDKLPGKIENASLYTISGFKFMNASNYWLRVVDKDSDGKFDTTISLAQMDSLVASNVSGEAATTTAGPAGPTTGPAGPTTTRGPAGPTTTRGNRGTEAAAAATHAAAAAKNAADAANKAAVSATAAAAAAAAAAALH